MPENLGDSSPGSKMARLDSSHNLMSLGEYSRKKDKKRHLAAASAVSTVGAQGEPQQRARPKSQILSSPVLLTASCCTGCCWSSGCPAALSPHAGR